MTCGPSGYEKRRGGGTEHEKEMTRLFEEARAELEKL